MSSLHGIVRFSRDLASQSLFSLTFAAVCAAATGLQAQTAAPAKDKLIELEVYTVTGSNIKRLDQEKVLPVTVIDRDAMEARNAVTPVQMLAALPQMVNVPINESNATGAVARGDVAAVNLRGIGSGNTLVLLNGRRLATHPVTQNEDGVLATSVNVNQLPTRGLDRIEVLRDGASAIYGSDAVAGVVNYLTDMAFRGAEINLRIGVPEQAGGQLESAALTYGTDFAGGRGRWVSMIEAFQRDELYLRDRPFSADADKTARAPAPFNATTSSFFDRNSSGPFPSFRVGTSTQTRFIVPASGGGAAIATGTPARTGVTADYYYNTNSDQMAFPRTRRLNWSNRAEFDLSERLTAFGEFSYYDAMSWFSRSPLPYSSSADRLLVVAADNPYNPFGSRFFSSTGAPNADGTARLTGTPQTVNILSSRIMDMGQERTEITSDALRLLGGFRGQLFDTWSWESAAYYTRARTTDTVLNALRESRMLAAALRTDASAFNPFGYTFKIDGSAVVPDKAYLNPASVMDKIYDVLPNNGETSIASVDFRASGTVWELWSGPLAVAVGGEYRNEKLSHTRPPYAGQNPADSGLNTNDNDFIQASATSDIIGERTVASLYAETVLPLVAPKNGIPLVQSLELNASVRGEHYDDFGDATKPKFGANWKPLPWIMARSSFNEGFRAPNLAVLNQRPRTIIQAYPDSFRVQITGLATDGNTNRTYVSSGSSSLQPEESKGRSFGLVVDVPAVKGLSFNADYWRIEQSNVIQSDTSADILASDNALLLAYTQQQLSAGIAVGAIDVGSGTAGYKGDPRAIRSVTISAAELALFTAYNAARPAAQRIAPYGALVSQKRAFSNRSLTRLEGVDFGMNYYLPELPFGNFSVASDWTHFNEYFTTLPGGTTTDLKAGQDGTTRWRGNATLTWRKAAWRAGLGAYYIGSYVDTGASTDATTYASLGEPGYIIKVFDQGRDNYYYSVGATTSYNAYLAYRFGQGSSKWMRNTTVRLSVENLTNAQPPFSSDIVGYNVSVYGNLAFGRTFSLEFTRRF